MLVTSFKFLGYDSIGVQDETLSSPVATLSPQNGGTSADIISGLQTGLNIPEDFSETHLSTTGLGSNSTTIEVKIEHENTQYEVDVTVSEANSDSVSPVINSDYRVDGRTQSRTALHNAIGLNTPYVGDVLHMPIQFTNDGRLCRAFRASFDDIVLNESVELQQAQLETAINEVKRLNDEQTSASRLLDDISKAVPKWAEPTLRPYRDSVLQHVHSLEAIQSQLVSIADLQSKVISTARASACGSLSEHATAEYRALLNQDDTEIEVDDELSIRLDNGGSANPNPGTLGVERRAALNAALRLGIVRTATNPRYRTAYSLPLIINADNYVVGSNSSLIDELVKCVEQLLADDFLQQVIWIAREEIPQPSSP